MLIAAVVAIDPEVWVGGICNVNQTSLFVGENEEKIEEWSGRRVK